MSERQFVAVRFRPGDKRTYTYHNDGPALFEGDRVKCPGRKPDDGWTAATVEAVSFEVPEFATKAILGRVEDAAAPPDEGRTAVEAGDDSDLFGGAL